MSVPPPPPGFELDQEPEAPRPRKRERSSIPPPPEGFKRDKAERSSRKGETIRDITVNRPSMASVMRAIDGDTLANLNDDRFRIFGMDAPELKQQGWDRAGQPVNIGEVSRNAMATLLAGQTVQPGPAISRSYGRTVAPVTIDGTDLGEGFIRDGNAFAAPSFLSSDPDRQFRYLQAERLARQNSLGLHDTVQQSPEEYRKNPGYVIPREEVARFWDVPTPNSGMRPEVEQRFYAMLNDPKISPEAISEFARTNGGFVVNPKEIAKGREAARKSGQPIGMHYTPAPQVLTDLGDGVTGASIRAGGTGFTASGLDELGAIADTLGGTDGRENIWNSDRRLADIWANNQAQNSSILGYDEFAHPTATTIGELSGALASGFVIPYGAGARTVPQLATVGGVYGGLEGFLGTDGDFGQRSLGAVKGVPVGAALNAAGGKALEVAAPYLGRVVDRIRGKAPNGTPEASLGDLGDIPPPPPGFTPDAPSSRSPDRINIYGPNAPREPMPEVPLDTSYPGAVGGRERDWIDTASIPEPPAGFKLDQPRAMAMDAEPMPSVSGELRQPDYLDMGAPRPQRLADPISDAQRQAIAQNMQPGDVLPIPSNWVGGIEDAAAIETGRLAPARAANERDQLERATLRGLNSDVPKVGPTDLVGWLRLNGGLVDQGGELAHMGVNNAARRGMDHVGQEARFGPLVSEQGMTLDDAALRAWEAGYFPDHAERPSVNDLLDAFRDTYEGRNRRFLPQDLDQLDRFDAARSDRLDLERRLQDGPVYDDRSVPADGPQPLPPIEAYQDWPAGGLKRVGNINVSKLDSPEDISRALSQVDKRFGMDAATRGRVTQQETARLADELGMGVDELLSRRTGEAYNAEQAFRARQFLTASAEALTSVARKIARTNNPGDLEQAAFQKALMRHVAVQEQIAGIAAEAGRTLAQFKMLADSNGLRRDVLSSIAETGGGPRRVKEAAEAILEDVETSPGKFNTKTREVAQPTWGDKFAEWYTAGRLWNPATHVVNMIGNTMTSLSQIPEYAGAAVIGAARNAVTRNAVDRVTASEIGERAFSLMQGAKEGAEAFVQAAKTGEPSDTFSKTHGHETKAIRGLKGEIIRLPFRALTAEDEFFKGIGRRMGINGLAVRQAVKEGLTGEAKAARIAELKANPTEDMLEKASEYARDITFQTPLGGLTADIAQAVRHTPWLRPVITFVKTPANLLKYAAHRSPLALLSNSWWADIKAGGARADIAAAKMMMGTGFATLFYNEALSGRITGSPPSDPAKYRYMRANGWQPYSVKLGDKWYSYSRLDPFSTAMGVAADLATRADGMSERQLENYSSLLIASIVENMGNKVWLSGVSDLANAMSDFERYGPSYMRRQQVNIAMPNVGSGPARALDPVQRQRNDLGEEFMSGIPGLSDNLLPKRDIWGQPITSEGSPGPDVLSPFRQSTQREDPVNLEMLAIGARNGFPSKNYSVGGVTKRWTPEQYDRLQSLSGPSAYSKIVEAMSDPAWPGKTNGEKGKIVDKAFRSARDEAKAIVLGIEPAPEGGKRSSDSTSVPPPPPGFSVDGESGGVNIYRDLQEAIPGIRFTSGYRSPEYNESLRARGYHPARNSAHLNGSGLDMLPPEGKSLDWLRQRIRERYPKARFLIHDGHLHGTFPGYYGAPVLGGARGAGNKNPLAGMPPPPPGFKLNQ